MTFKRDRDRKFFRDTGRNHVHRRIAFPAMRNLILNERDGSFLGAVAAGIDTGERDAGGGDGGRED